MKNISYLIIVLSLLLSLRTTAQKVDTFNFVVENQQIIDGSTGLFWGFEYEFSYRRVWTGPTPFNEENLLGGKSSHSF